MSLAIALRRSMAGYALAWSVVLEEVARQDPLGEQSFALLLQVSAAMGLLLSHVQAEIAEVHSVEITRSARSRKRRRDAIVHKLLAGKEADPDELVELDYELDAWHIAVIATGAGAKKAVRCLEGGFGCEFLAVAGDAHAMWTWLGGQRRLAFTDLEHVLSAQDDVDVSLAVGEPARGLEGWIQTHREAEGAQRVARCRPRRLTRYLDVAPEATALQDGALADSLIERYLSPLDEISMGAQAARGALRALFDTEHNVSSAAHVLSVHRSTVHRWRNEIEQRLGCPLRERQVDIEIALRVEELSERRDVEDAMAASRNATS